LYIYFKETLLASPHFLSVTYIGPNFSQQKRFWLF